VRGPETDQLDSVSIARINVALLGQQPSKWRLANSFLHALNFSSKNVKFYAPLIAGKYGLGLAFTHLLRGLANVAASFAFVGPDFFGDKLPQRTSILFISHLNRPSDYTAPSDQYYANLADQSVAQDLTSAVVMLNKCRARKTAIDVAPSVHVAPRIVCAPYLSPLREIWHFLAALLTGLGASIQSLFLRGMRRRLGVFTGLAQASARTLVGLRFRHQILQIVKQTNAKKIVFTYEGHPWERLVCQAIRAEFPAIELIGYQHSLVLAGPKAMTSKIPVTLTPHKLLVTSEVTAGLLAKDDGTLPKKIISVGSPKFVDSSGRPGANTAKSILIVPEGTPEDTLPMAEFAIALARLLKDKCSPIKVTIRLHPLLSFEWLALHCTAVKTMPDNVVFSARSLAEDAAEAGWILYRGSTAIFTAVAFGGRPLFLEFQDDVTANDPLMNAGSYRRLVRDAEAAMAVMFADVKSQRLDKDGVSRSPEQQDLIDFAAAYFPPLDEKAFLEELRLTNSSND